MYTTSQSIAVIIRERKCLNKIIIAVVIILLGEFAFLFLFSHEISFIVIPHHFSLSSFPFIHL